MQVLVLLGLLACSTLWVQEPSSNSQPPPSLVQGVAPATPPIRTITVPAGTRIPLALAGPINSKTRPGAAVRAVTGFPVTVGSKLAIPVGTYVEGAIDKVSKGGRSGPNLQMHFTQLLYANGYSVDIDGASVQAKALSPNSGFSEAAALAANGSSGNSLAAQALPETPQLQPPVSHIGIAIGIGVAAAAAGIAIPLILLHHGGGRVVLFDTGWQFEMVLNSPLSVDAASVAAAVKQ